MVPYFALLPCEPSVSVKKTLIVKKKEKDIYETFEKWRSQNWTFRSNHCRCSIQKGVIEIFAKITGKHLSRGLFFNKAGGLTLTALLKERLRHRCFSANFNEIFNNIFFTEHLRITGFEPSHRTLIQI